MLRKMIKGGYRRKNNNEWSFQIGQDVVKMIKGGKNNNEWRFSLSNEDLHNICGTEDIGIYVGRQQQKYLAHIARQPNNTLTKRLLFNCDESRKPGPKLTLESNVLKNLQCSADEFFKKALDRRC